MFRNVGRFLCVRKRCASSLARTYAVAARWMTSACLTIRGQKCVAVSISVYRQLNARLAVAAAALSFNMSMLPMVCEHVHAYYTSRFTPVPDKRLLVHLKRQSRMLQQLDDEFVYL